MTALVALLRWSPLHHRSLRVVTRELLEAVKLEKP
jgi:hypothetical protein